MKGLVFILILALVLIPPALADGNMTNSTNITPPPEPVIVSFQGGHMFGENPVEIFNNETGRPAFLGNTSSKQVNLSPDFNYNIRVEPAGISDAANAPDAGVIGAMKWAEKNPFGTFFFSTLAAAVIISFKRRK